MLITFMRMQVTFNGSPSLVHTAEETPEHSGAPKYGMPPLCLVQLPLAVQVGVLCFFFFVVLGNYQSFFRTLDRFLLSKLLFKSSKVLCW
jgi:hypothetical protein